MQMNNGFFRGARTINRVIASVIFLIAGLVFAGIGVYLLVKPDASENPNTVLDIVFIVVGLVVAIIAIVSLVFAVRDTKKRKPLTEEEVKANEERLHAGEQEIRNLTDAKFFFHFGGKLNQSYFVEDKEGRKHYEIILRRFNPVASNVYEFNDLDNSFSKKLKVGKVVSSSTDGGLPFVGDTLTSRFKIDGVQCWDYLRQRGYEIKWYILERPFARFELHKMGKLVAKITPCNIKDPWNEGSMNLLRFGHGVFRIEIIDCRLDDAVMAAFIAARTNIVE